jgi:glutaredoxin 3
MSAAPNDIIVYSSPMCGYCAAAKRLLRGKGVQFTEIDVLFHPKLRREMIELSGRRTVPQIFVHGTHVGGYDDLKALDDAGRLDTMLAGEPNIHNTDEA